MSLTSLLAAPPTGPLVALALPAPLAPPEAFLRLPLPGDPLLWDARPWGEPWALAGRGAAAVVEARGAGRFAQIRREGQGLLSAIDVRLAPGVEPGLPRLLGGASFEVQSFGVKHFTDPQPSEDIPWGPFGEARFVLPRWAYERRSDAARLWLIVGADEVAGQGEGEVARVLRWLAEGVDGAGERLEPRAGQGRADREGPPASRPLHPQDYLSAVSAALDAIAQKRLSKVVVARAQPAALPDDFDPWSALTRFEGPLTRFAFGRGEQLFVGATPERLVELSDGRVRSEAVAGSIRGDEPGAAERLLASTKDRREHAPVVEAITAALASRCVEISAEPTGVRPLRHLLHLVTRLRGVARPGTHVLDLVEALHPTPAVGGVPRDEARRWLREREGLSRGWYAGPVGWFDAKGEGQFAVALRSALLGPGRAWLFAGSGVVEGSEPEAELRETSVKLRAMVEALAGGAP